MCNRLEECLVSKLGFRIFILFAVVLLVVAVGVNVNFLASKKSPTWMGRASFEATKDLESPSATNSPHSPKILVWRPDGDKGDSFYHEFYQRIRWLRRNQCPELWRCSFASHVTKMSKADAVVMVIRDYDLDRIRPVQNATSFADHGSKPREKRPSNGTQQWQRRNDTKEFLSYRQAKDKTWAVLAEDPSQLRSAPDTYFRVMKQLLGVDHLPYELGNPLVISYAPDSDIPLASHRFESSQRVKPKLEMWERVTGIGEDNDDNSRLDRVEVSSKALFYPRLLDRNNNSTSPMLVATVINHCHTNGNREGYLKELNRTEGLRVDSYGKCGARPCPGHTEEECLEYLAKRYWFILVFETDVCQHYASPRLLRVLATPSPMIPVVFGGINYHSMLIPADQDSNLAANRNYDHDLFMIDALGQTPAALSHYLRHLAPNLDDVTSLLNYIKWRSDLSLEVREWPCELCKKLVHAASLPPDDTSDRYSAAIQGSHEGRNVLFGRRKLTGQIKELCTSWPQLDFGG